MRNLTVVTMAAGAALALSGCSENTQHSAGETANSAMSDAGSATDHAMG